MPIHTKNQGNSFWKKQFFVEYARKTFTWEVYFIEYIYAKEKIQVYSKMNLKDKKYSQVTVYKKKFFNTLNLLLFLRDWFSI